MKGEINAAVIFAYAGVGFFINMVVGEQLPMVQENISINIKK